MTTAEVVESTGSQEPPGRPQSWGDIAASLAGQVAQLGQHSRGDLAELRRMDPYEPDAAVFWRLMAQNDLLNRGESVENKWALILHGIALMTPASRDDDNPRTAHDGYMPVGRALFLGGEAQRTQAYYSEARLNRLLTAGGPILRTLLARMFRMLAASDASFDWREMAQFILIEGHDEDAAERSRRRIAREYYRAERRSGQRSPEND